MRLMSLFWIIAWTPIGIGLILSISQYQGNVNRGVILNTFCYQLYALENLSKGQIYV